MCGKREAKGIKVIEPFFPGHLLKTSKVVEIAEWLRTLGSNTKFAGVVLGVGEPDVELIMLYIS